MWKVCKKRGGIFGDKSQERPPTTPRHPLVYKLKPCTLTALKSFHPVVFLETGPKTAVIANSPDHPWRGSGGIMWFEDPCDMVKKKNK